MSMEDIDLLSTPSRKVVKGEITEAFVYLVDYDYLSEAEGILGALSPFVHRT